MTNDMVETPTAAKIRFLHEAASVLLHNIGALKASREVSLALTKVDEAVLWAERAIKSGS